MSLIELLPTDPTQLLLEMDQDSTGICIMGACRPAAFDRLAGIIATGQRMNQHLFLQPEERNDELVHYRACLPDACLDRPLRFEAVEKSGSRSPCFMPASVGVSLLPNWAIRPFTLSLEYRGPRPVAENEDSCRCFVRSIELGEELDLQLDFSLISHAAPAEDSELHVSACDGEEPPSTFKATCESAKRVFRISTRLHRHYTGRDAWHIRAAIPLSPTFGALGSYDIHVSSPPLSDQHIYPYNRYYRRKSSSFAALVGSERVLRHFADPRSGAVQLHLSCA